MAAGTLGPSFRQVNGETNSISTVLVQIPGGNADGRRVLGRFLGERQVEFASSIGCKKVVLIGGGTPEALATRHRAEELGLTLREISGPHALAACVTGGERLLALQENLLPTVLAFPLAEVSAGGVLVLPSGAGSEAGFERIDLARAWSGALVVDGKQVASLLELPEDSDTAPSLLRIALQARLPEASMAESALADGSWSLIGPESDLALLEEKWLARIVSPSPDAPASRLLVGSVFQHFGSRLAVKTSLATIALGLGCLLAAAGVALAWIDSGFLSFAAIALSVFGFEFALGAKRLVSAPVEPDGYWHRLPWLIDLAIFASGVLSIDGEWYQRLFPPLMLLAALHLAKGRHENWLGRLRDRALIAAIVGTSALLASVEVGIMLSALSLAAYALLPRGKRRG